MELVLLYSIQCTPDFELSGLRAIRTSFSIFFGSRIKFGASSNVRKFSFLGFQVKNSAPQ